ncbi:GntR family transcriptional regulator [Nakamurella leprariae]|uniref:GntR family transcriptional regulator n=1 Tax=Nakamurella leprariae TaxID=2803911 RepID=A0A938YJ82_9ACTN|nr:GntR family transcriptional regulator [Nakamurella leprariae]MBM9468858.1 GntR family transcriptional regulator [Nakamurella leprariae]
MFDEGTPLFVQIAERLAGDVVDGTLPEGARVPSSNEFAAFYRINPATAAKGINLLVDQGVLEKRRGVGMFVVPGAREQLLAARRDRFADQFVVPMLAEARRLGLDLAAVLASVEQTDRALPDHDPDRSGPDSGSVLTQTPAVVPRTPKEAS